MTAHAINEIHDLPLKPSSIFTQLTGYTVSFLYILTILLFFSLTCSLTLSLNAIYMILY